MTTNELSKSTVQLPDTIEDLTRFALIGREKLIAVRAEIRAIEKVGLAKEVHEQKLREAQEIAEAVLDAEQRMGELLKAIPKQTANQYTSANSTRTEKAKSDITSDLGITKDQVSQFQRLADNPSIVNRAKQEARDRGEVISRTAVLRQIAAETAQKPANKPKSDVVEAKLRHDAIKQADIVSMDEIRQDRTDRRTIAFEFYRDLLNVTHKAITAAIWNSPDDIDDLMEIIPDDRWPHFCEQIEKTVYLLNRIKVRRAEWKEKVSTRMRRKQ